MKIKLLFGIIILTILGCSGDKGDIDIPKKTISQTTQSPVISDDIIAKWKWNIIGAVINLTNKNNAFVLETKFDDGSSRKRNVSLNKVGNIIEIRVIDDNPRGEYYKINSTGDLEFWDKAGKSSTATVIKKFNYNF